MSPFDVVGGVYFGFRFESRLSKGPVLHVRICVTNFIGNGKKKKRRKEKLPGVICPQVGHSYGMV